MQRSAARLRLWTHPSTRIVQEATRNGTREVKRSYPSWGNDRDRRSIWTGCSKSSSGAVSIPHGTEVMSGSVIREKFLKFYEARGHRRLPSSSLIPDDPTVLLTIAGMLQFKPIFLGQVTPEFKRATTTQKCVRTNDVENVGVTSRHHTFFEMLGNFSFGDYFKKTAIEWAWEISTREFGIPSDRIYASVFDEDDEAYEIWKSFLPEHKILRMGREDNFWAAGSTGPCGPCSELYYDFHPERGTSDIDLNDDTRFVEFYNLVFMEKNREADGSLTELKNKNIDTGMGLERMAQILQKTSNTYETDLVMPIIDRAAEEAAMSYADCTEEQRRHLKVIGDHARAVVYLVADGVVPSNIGRGYILRRLIRRMIMKTRLLNIDRPILKILAEEVIDLSIGCDPNVEKQRERIVKTLEQEEIQFGKTLTSGRKKMKEFVRSVRELKGSTMTGQQAFVLFDTYGFPLEITQEMAAVDGLEVDVEGFEAEMAEQKLRSKSARRDIDLETGSDLMEYLATLPRTEFTGYDALIGDGRILSLIHNGRSVDSLVVRNGSPVEFDLILDRTPFYAESGGQIGDKGIVKSFVSNSETTMNVIDVQESASNGLTLHKAILERGSIGVDQSIQSTVDGAFRHRLMCHHTATHLLQSAIKHVLGDDTCQQGSLVAADRLRFDFNASKAPSQEQIVRIESCVNRWIQSGIPLRSEVMALDVAKEAGAIAMFGEKYGEQVRVVQVPGVSMELCGGTHVENTSQLCVFKIVSESAIQSGVRRIEAVAGQAAVERFMSLSRTCEELKSILKIDIDGIPDRIKELQNEIQQSSKRVDALVKESTILKAERLDEEMLPNGCRLILGRLDGVDGKALQAAAVHLIDRSKSPCAVIVGGIDGDRVAFAAAFSKELIKASLHAGKFVAEVAAVCGGRGGGRPNAAQAGGKDIEKFDQALRFAKEQLLQRLRELSLQ